MGYITHPWSLVICVLVINLAVLVTARDDVDPVSMTEDHPKSRDVDVDDLDLTERSSMESIRDRTRRRWDAEGTFIIKVTVGELPGSGATRGRIYLKVLYKLGNDWFGFPFMGNRFWSGFTHTIKKSNQTHYYSSHEQIDKIFIKNRGNAQFYPRKIEIETPEDCKRYVCDWGRQCGEDRCPRTNPPKPPLCSCYIVKDATQEIDCEFIGKRVANCY